MKYLVSALELGRLIEMKKSDRKDMVANIICLQYVKGTSDKENLDDCIRLNSKK